MKRIGKDCSFLLRQFARRPLLYALIVFILALGIGANTAMFTLSDAVLYRDLAVRDTESLVRVFATPEKGGEITNGSWPDYLMTRDQVEGVESAAAYADTVGVLVDWQGTAPERTQAAVATGNFFDVLGVAPRVGQLVLDADDNAETVDRYAVLSHHAWRTQYNSDPGVIGRNVSVNRQPYTITGVLPAEFSSLDVNSQPMVWLPLSASADLMQGLPPDVIFSERFSWLDVVARLAPGVTVQQLQSEMDARAQPIAEERAKQSTRSGVGPWRRVMPSSEAAVDPYGNLNLRRNAMLLTVIVVLVLLLACANVSGLVLVRAEERAREFAIRASVGATRRALLRMLLVENLAIALAGAFAGLLLAQGMLTWIAVNAPQGVVVPLDAAGALLEPRVLLMTSAIAIVVTLLAGTVPAWRAARQDPNNALKNTGAMNMPQRHRFRSGLVILQISASAVILVAAGLLLRSFWNTLQVDPGFPVDNAVTVTMDISGYGVEDGERDRMLERIHESVQALPGVEAAGFSQTVPVQNSGWRTTVQAAASETELQADMFITTPGFIDALGTRLVAGRDFVQGDTLPDAADVVLVNETLARRLWPERSALGQVIPNFGDEGARVVGIVADHKTRSLHEPVQPAVYRNLSSMRSTAMSLVVRANREPSGLVTEVRDTVRAIDPELPIFRERTLREHLARSYAEMRTFAWLLGGFSVLALLLAATGLYGLLANTLRARRREFGIRIALGAAGAGIAWLVVRHVATLVGFGLAAGLLLASVSGRLLEGLLFGITAFDVVTLAIVPLLVVGVALLAALGPARGAMNTEPAGVLREE